MNANKNQTKSFFIAIAVLLIVSLACGSTDNQTQPPSTDGQGQSEPSELPQKTNTPQPTNTPRPTLTPTLVPIGLSRNNPYPLSELVSAPNWDVQVLEVKRGEGAWTDIHAANMFNEPAPEGMEYLLVKIHVKSTYTDSDAHTINGCYIDVTGDRLIAYTCSMASVVEPEPQLDAKLYTGGEAEGWAAYPVGQGEGNLILVVNESWNFDENAIRYIALDEGASIGISPDLASIQSTDIGVERNTPAHRTEKVISEDWEISVLEVIRGDEAWAMVYGVNKFNDPPEEGMEYIAVKIQARYIGTEDRAENIDNSSFKTTGSAGVLYDRPYVIGPDPELSVSLYPGGEYVGWVIVQAAKGETGLMLVFEPLFDIGDKNNRFISLEP